MKYLKEEDSWLRNGLIRQPIRDQQYRKSIFVVDLPVEDGVLLYNTATGSMLYFESDLELQYSKEILISNWFYVPAIDFDEFLWVSFLRDKKRELASNNPMKSYLIMTTMDCNARCFYCYEKGRHPISMTAKTANDVSNYILTNAENKKVKLSWFGGEPLVNYKVIDLICEGLKRNRFNYVSHMISNGLLFSDDIIAKALNQWNLRRVQITIDGTESQYLKIKSFKNGKGDEFQKIMRNIEALLKNGILVSIRLNQSLNTTDDLLILVDLIKDKFSFYNNLSVYNRLLFDEEITSEVQLAYFSLKHKLQQIGLLKPKSIEAIKHSQCMADNDFSLVITPNGNLGKCEHFSEDHFIGSIYDTRYNQQMITQFKETHEQLSSCNSCALYPSCVRLKMCPSQLNICHEFTRADLLDNLHFMMKSYYQKFKENSITSMLL